MKTLKDLTPEIEYKIPEYIERGLKGVFDGKRYENFNIEKAIQAVSYNYELSGYKAPLVLVAENPFEAQLLFNFVRLTIKDDNLNSQLDSQLDSQLISQLRSQLGSQLYSQLDSQLRSQLDSQLDSQLYSQLDSQLRSQLDSQLYSQLDSQKQELFKIHNEYLFTINVYSDCYYNWFEFMRKELNISLDKNTNKIFQKIFKLQKESGVYNAIFSESLCVVSKYPKKVHRNKSNDLHNVNGCSVEWNYYSPLTNFKCFYVNGRNIDEKLINESFSKEDLINEKNEDVKAAMITIIKEREGDEGLLNFLNAIIVDEQILNHFDGYSESVKLWKTKEKYSILQDRHGNMNQPYCWSEIRCPSTKSTYLIENSADFIDAKEALSWLRPSFVPQDLKYKWHHSAN